jgi:hypothetical protein
MDKKETKYRIVKRSHHPNHFHHYMTMEPSRLIATLN